MEIRLFPPPVTSAISTLFAILCNTFVQIWRQQTGLEIRLFTWPAGDIILM